MSLLIPETGLLFWMLLAFGVVFFVLAKYGWPVITGMVEKRSDYINESVKAAEESYRKLENIKQESDTIVEEARKKQMDILQEAANLKNKILDDARIQAKKEADKLIENAQLSIRREKEEALKDIRSQVALLSVDIAEKIVRQKLAGEDEQKKLVDKLLDEMKLTN